MIDTIIQLRHEVKKLNPLVLNITNYVAMNNSANVLLAIGASPIMSKEFDEMEDLAKICNSLVINIGTLEKNEIPAVLLAQSLFNQLNKPVILDPVGVGASNYRNNIITKILGNGKVNYIRGNGSEIISLAGFNTKSKGVDSTNSSTDAINAAKEIVEKYNNVVCISGEKDVIASSDGVTYVNNGSKLMTSVTALGCSASAILGAYAALDHKETNIAISACAIISICGQIAATKSEGPGTLQVNLLDTIHNVSDSEIKNIASISI